MPRNEVIKRKTSEEEFALMDEREIPDEETIDQETLSTISREFTFMQIKAKNFGRAYYAE